MHKKEKKKKGPVEPEKEEEADKLESFFCKIHDFHNLFLLRPLLFRRNYRHAMLLIWFLLRLFRPSLPLHLFRLLLLFRVLLFLLLLTQLFRLPLLIQVPLSLLLTQLYRLRVLFFPFHRLPLLLLRLLLIVCQLLSYVP